jgi:hypothetical protein
MFLALVMFAGVRYQDRVVPLTQVYAPSFPRVEFASPAESLRALDARFLNDPRLSTIRQLLPDQAGVLWISLLVLLAVGFDYSRPWSARNIDLLIAQAIGWCFIGSLDMLVESSRGNDPARHGLIRFVFEIVAVLTVVLMARVTWRATRPDATIWTPALGVRPLAAVATVAVVLSLAMPFLRPVEDSSYFTSLGAQRLRERGALPYGDPLLTNTPGAAYAPLLYAAQAAAQFLVREPVNASSPDLPVLGEQSQYRAPSPVASLFLLAASQLLAVWALLSIGRRWKDTELGVALVALYCASAAVLGVGGSGDQVSGMTFVSHIVPPAIMLVAFRYLDRPWLSGLLLAASAATGFYPAFMFPAWLAYQWGRSPRSAIHFAAGWSALCLIVAVWVLVASRSADGLSLIGTIVRDTLGHQTSPEGYGRAPFGLWGQQTGVMRWMLEPLAGSPMSSPMFLLYGSFLLVTAALARNAGPVGLALLTAAIALGANIWRIPGTGSYMNWYYPFVLIGAIGPGVLIRRQPGSSENQRPG